jgi:hypothetical protein
MSRYARNELLRVFYYNRVLHPVDLVTKHPLDFVVHGFSAGGAEMDRHPVGSFILSLVYRWIYPILVDYCILF